MAQTQTKLIGGGIGDFSKLKVVAINVANGANETSLAVNYATHGISEVLLYGHTIRDTYTNNVQFDNLSGTTVTHTWSAADVANVIVWAIGK